MKMKLLALGLALMLCASTTSAQQLPRMVSNVAVLDLNEKVVKLPHFGEQHLMIFYVDPDKHKQNNDFTVELEKNHRADSKNIYGFGIMNLKDAPMVPNGIARSMARKRTEKNGALVLADQNRTLSTAWKLGDCNNQFVLLFVTKEGELVFMRKGELSEADIQAFYKVLDKYK
ncbi:MAG: YtfJ family protein [Alistipes sp.]